MVYWLDLFGVAVFALSGALMAGKHHLDPFGVIVLAGVTAIGGGTIRDVILGAQPVFWITDINYIIVILGTAQATITLAKEPGKQAMRLLLVADAFGLALFAVLGTQKALAFDSPVASAMVLGTITGVAGGMIRDTLCREIPMVLRREIYATACILGSGCYCACIQFGLSQDLATVIAICAGLSLRLLAIYFHLSMPQFKLDK